MSHKKPWRQSWSLILGPESKSGFFLRPESELESGYRHTDHCRILETNRSHMINKHAESTHTEKLQPTGYILHVGTAHTSVLITVVHNKA